jgi:hypothetical protein
MHRPVASTSLSRFEAHAGIFKLLIKEIYMFNRENPQNSEPQNGPRSGLDYIALTFIDDEFSWTFFGHENFSPWVNFRGHILSEF